MLLKNVKESKYLKPNNIKELDEMIRGVKDLNTLNNIKEYIEILMIDSIYGDL